MAVLLCVALQMSLLGPLKAERQHLPLKEDNFRGSSSSRGKLPDIPLSPAPLLLPESAQDHSQKDEEAKRRPLCQEGTEADSFKDHLQPHKADTVPEGAYRELRGQVGRDFGFIPFSPEGHWEGNISGAPPQAPTDK